ncbi:MAG: CinA family protein [Porphyromonadaceae bacterium]|nr:CinA family protein [Porphyromonadaceae bacterium]
MEELIAHIHGLCLKSGLTLSTAESCTGGRLASLMTSISGASKVFRSGVIAYSAECKTALLGVPSDLIELHTVVSREVAESMAIGVATLLEADIGLATTGIAGPTGGTKQTPVGSVWIALSYRGATSSRMLSLQGDRADVVEQACYELLTDLLKMLQALG